MFTISNPNPSKKELKTKLNIYNSFYIAVFKDTHFQEFPSGIFVGFGHHPMATKQNKTKNQV